MTATEAPAEFTIPDERTERERYRIYRADPCAACTSTGTVYGRRCAACGGKRRELTLIHTTPTAGGIGLSIVTAHEDGNLDGNSNVGVLDGIESTWLVNPFAR